MDFFNKKKVKIDSRIDILTMQLPSGAIETYPKGSFVIDYLFIFEEHKFNVLTTTTSTVNTFHTYTSNDTIINKISIISKPRIGMSSGFFFYELTVSLQNKNNNNSINSFNYLLQTLNIFDNQRWFLFSKLQKNTVKTITNTYPAAIWAEREVQDMYNIKISNTRDTRRLLLDYKVNKGVMLPGKQIKGLNYYSSFYDLYYL